MATIFLMIAVLITILAGIAILLLRYKVISISNKPTNIALNALFVIGVVYILLTLLSAPVSNQINAYKQKVLSESEEECKKDNAPFWCNL
ncbi:MAG: hypothetical protein AAF304_00340 [Pseudomonadota bacterium]